MATSDLHSGGGHSPPLAISEIPPPPWTLTLRAVVIVPPRATTVPSQTAASAPTRRSRYLQLITERGRIAWQNASRYAKRARAEPAIDRFKRVIGEGASLPVLAVLALGPIQQRPDARGHRWTHHGEPQENQMKNGLVGAMSFERENGQFGTRQSPRLQATAPRSISTDRT